MPYKYSGKNFNFAEKEEFILQNMRRWCKEFFKNSDTAENLLSNVKSTEKDTNLLCKVMKIFEDDERILRIKDKDGKSYKIEVDKIKYPELNNGDIIRVKSAKPSTEGGENILEIRPHTNILKFMKDSRIFKNLNLEITDTELDRVIIDKEEPIGELIITKDRPGYKSLKKITLLDLFFPKEYTAWKNGKKKNNRQEPKVDSESDKYLLEFSIVGYEPREIKEFVQAFCSHCKYTYAGIY